MNWLWKIFLMFSVALSLSSDSLRAADEYPSPCDGVQGTDNVSGLACTSLGAVKDTAKGAFKAIGADKIWDFTSNLFGKLYGYVVDLICWFWDYKVVRTLIDKPGFCTVKAPPTGAKAGPGCIHLTSGSLADSERVKECCDPTNPNIRKNPPCESNLPVNDIGSAGERLGAMAVAVAKNIEKAEELINLNTPPIKNGPSDEMGELAGAVEAAAESSTTKTRNDGRQKNKSSNDGPEKSQSRSKGKFIPTDPMTTLSDPENPLTSLTLPHSTSLDIELENLIQPRASEAIGVYGSSGFSGSGSGNSSSVTVENQNAPSVLTFGEASEEATDVNPLGTEDPDDYFSRIGRHESLFKRVHDRYQMHALQEMKKKFQK